MTETAREADYVLQPAASSRSRRRPSSTWSSRATASTCASPCFDPLPGTLPEAEIHARLVEALGSWGTATTRRYGVPRGLDACLRPGVRLAVGAQPEIARYAAVVLYRTLGPTLPAGMAPAASLWGIAQMYVRSQPDAARRAGFGGPAVLAGNRLFDAILRSPSGLIFAVSDVQRQLGGRAASRSPDQLVASRTAARVGEARHRTAASGSGVPLRPVGGRATKRDQQHVGARRGLAHEGALRDAAHQPAGRGRAAMRGRGHVAPQHPARQRSTSWQK